MTTKRKTIPLRRSDGTLEQADAIEFFRDIEAGRLEPLSGKKIQAVTETEYVDRRLALPYRPESVLDTWRESPNAARNFLGRLDVEDVDVHGNPKSHLDSQDLDIVDAYLDMRLRHGKQIEGSPPVPLTLAEDWMDVLDRRRRYTRRGRGGVTRQRHGELVQQQENVVKIVRSLGKIGAEIGGIELAALIANLYGREEVPGYADAIHYGYRGGLFTRGSIKRVSHLFEGDESSMDVARVEDSLKDLGHAASYRLIQETIGARPPSIRHINRACNVLECMGSLHKLPRDTRLRSAPYMWIHDDHYRSGHSIPTWNGKYSIMLAVLDLHGRQQDTNRSSIEAHPQLDDFRGKNSSPSFNTVRSLNDLCYSGLLDATTKTTVRGRKPVPHYRPTVEALSAFSSTFKDGYLDEGLNQALIGSRVLGLTYFEEYALDSFIAYLAAHEQREIGESIPGRYGQGPKEISKRLKTRGIQANPETIEGWLYRGANPVKTLRAGVVDAKFMSHLTEDQRTQYLRLKKNHPEYF